MQAQFHGPLFDPYSCSQLHYHREHIEAHKTLLRFPRTVSVSGRALCMSEVY
jgi:hypothetical protein